MHVARRYMGEQPDLSDARRVFTPAVNQTFVCNGANHERDGDCPVVVLRRV
jgi:hypothetical protein